MSFYDVLVRRPVTVVMMAIAAAVFGLVSYSRLPLTLMPDLAYPTLTVRTELPGAAPEEVESQVARPVEEALSTAEGLVRIESRSRAGVADVVLQYAWGSDMDQASQDIRERLQTTWLPDDAERPLILRYDPSLEPVLRLVLSWDPASGVRRDGEASELLLRQVAENQVKRRLEAMEGVAAVRVRGGLEREVRVEARETWMSARGVTLDQIIATIGAENVNLPGGTIFQGDQAYLVRTLGEVRSVAEIEALQILRSDGVRVPLREVAVVTDGHKDREVLSALDGVGAVELEVYKTADSNIVAVSQALQRRLGLAGEAEGAITQDLPKDMRISVLDNQAAFIESALSNLRHALFEGALLSVAVIYLFLRNWRATLIISTSIQLSLVMAMAPLYLGGVSLNLMTLGGLALGAGMIVDNSIVVLEAIQQHVDHGASRLQAAVAGTREIAAAVIASTISHVGVFLPIAFVEGVAGQVFGDLSLAVVYSITASLLVALLFVPMLAALDLSVPDARGRLRDITPARGFPSVGELRQSWREAEGRGRWARRLYAVLRCGLYLCTEIARLLAVLVLAVLVRGLLAAVVLAARPFLWAADRVAARFGAWYDRQAARYGQALSRGLGRPGPVLLAATAAVLASALLAPWLGAALIPEMHQGRFTADLALPVGTPLGHTARVTDAAVAAIREIPGVVHVFATTGAEQRVDARADAGEHTARLSIQLDPAESPERIEGRVMPQVREALAALPDPGLEVRLARPNLFSFQTPLEVVIYAQDLELLRQASGRAMATLQGMEGLQDVRSSLVAGYPEVRVTYNRDLLLRLGLSTSQAAGVVQAKIQGQTASRISRDDGRVDLVVQLDADERRSLDDLGRINLNPNIDPPIPLRQVATLTEGVGPSEIRRLDQRRVAVVSANVAGFSLSAQADAARAALADAGLDADWEIAGQDLEMRRSLSSLGFALLLAIFLIYVVMASTFESVVQPFVLLLTLPLAGVGVTPLLLLTGTPVSVVVLIGAIVLAGVVVNNSIVMVDCINRLRSEGVPRLEAIHQGAMIRLRPILITALTAILGVVPLALGFGEGAEVQQPLALTIMGGLSSSTFLTLFVVPLVYERVTALLERA